jgi:alpha/beta superfamily hydrolase
MAELSKEKRAGTKRFVRFLHRMIGALTSWARLREVRDRIHNSQERRFYSTMTIFHGGCRYCGRDIHIHRSFSFIYLPIYSVKKKMNFKILIAFISSISALLLPISSINAVEPNSIIFPAKEAPFNVAGEESSFLVDGKKVSGTLATPVGKSPAPVVLLLHGYGGHRNHVVIRSTGEGILQRAARTWAKSGYASLRIDFRGSGKSETAWAETTFSRQVEDAVQALSFLRSSKLVDGKRIAVVGFSQGGMIAAALAAKTPSLRGVGLWNAVTIPPATYRHLLGGEKTLIAGLKTAQ